MSDDEDVLQRLESLPKGKFLLAYQRTNPKATPFPNDEMNGAVLKVEEVASHLRARYGQQEDMKDILQAYHSLVTLVADELLPRRTKDHTLLLELLTDESKAEFQEKLERALKAGLHISILATDFEN